MDYVSDGPRCPSASPPTAGVAASTCQTEREVFGESVERQLYKLTALLAVAIGLSGCTPKSTEVTGTPADEPRAALQSAPSQDPTNRNADQKPDATGDDANEIRGDRAKAVATGMPKDSPAASRRPKAKRERPWAHNTGPTDRAALTPSKGFAIKTDGAVLEDLDVTGTVTIDADDVTLRNFRIKATSWYAIRVEDGHSGIVIEDGEIYGMSSAGILGVGYIARGLHIHDSGSDGIKAQGSGGPTVVEHCFIEKLGTNDGAHADGNQTAAGSNITFRYNNIYMPSPGTPAYPGAPYKSNATFKFEAEPPKIQNFVIENNWLTGGNYTIYCRPGISARNNIIGRENGGWPRKEERRVRSGKCNEWSGNRWEDTGGPI